MINYNHKQNFYSNLNNFNFRLNYTRTCSSMCSTTILDLPTEIFESVIFPYLRDEDVFNFGKIGIKRFEDLANGFLKDNKCK